jgi:hypothetical protein
MGAMGTTYAVSWRDSDGTSDSGRLELGPRAMRLEGAGRLELAYTEVIDIAIGRDNGDRIGGCMTVLVTRASGRPLWVAPVAERAALLELHDRLVELAADGASAEV